MLRTQEESGAAEAAVRRAEADRLSLTERQHGAGVARVVDTDSESEGESDDDDGDDCGGGNGGGGGGGGGGLGDAAALTKVTVRRRCYKAPSWRLAAMGDKKRTKG